jgi:arginyl-tRNA synthetase
MLELLTQPITTLIARHLNVESARVDSLYAPPGKGFTGDLALPCFQLAKARNVAPAALAAELCSVIAGSDLGASAVQAGPFVNLTFAPARVATRLLPQLAVDPLLALRSHVGEGRTVCIDFSSPNIAKHMAFHHLRGTMIGNALSRCYAAAGYRVVRINFLGDWGTAFGRLIAGFKRENLTIDDVARAPDKVTFLNDLYVRISQAEAVDPSVSEQARVWSKKLEEGDPEVRAIWAALRQASIDELMKIYALLGVDFDSWNGEAYYNDKTDPLVAELEQKGLTRVDDGATVVDLEAFGLEKPSLVRRADGGSFYSTRDIAAADDRYRQFAFHRSLYVVDLGQSLHFKEWFAIVKLLGRPYANSLRHVGFGIVLMWNDEPGPGLTVGWGRGRSRGGRVMLLRDVLEEAIERARAIVAEKSPELPGRERDDIARAVGIGALVFNDLKNARTNDVKFKFEDALSMQGETGPYLQYAHARLCSIERKFAELHGVPLPFDATRLSREEEKQVFLAVARLRTRLERTVESDEPSVMAQALLALAWSVASWLTAGNQEPAMRVLSPDAELASARHALVRVARVTLGEGLRLLGLEAPLRM